MLFYKSKIVFHKGLLFIKKWRFLDNRSMVFLGVTFFQGTGNFAQVYFVPGKDAKIIWWINFCCGRFKPYEIFVQKLVRSLLIS